MNPVTEQQTAATTAIDCDALIGVFTNFLQFDVANGKASGDTIVTYWTQVRQYLEWCRSNSLDPLSVTRENIKIYRWWLSEQQGYKPKTIAVKLTAVSRLYDAAIEYGLIGSNPAWGIKAPTESIDPAARITYLEQDEATILLKSIGNHQNIKTIRDKLLLGVMTLEGIRTVEMYRQPTLEPPSRQRVAAHDLSTNFVRIFRISELPEYAIYSMTLPTVCDIHDPYVSGLARDVERLPPPFAVLDLAKV